MGGFSDVLSSGYATFSLDITSVQSSRPRTASIVMGTSVLVGHFKMSSILRRLMRGLSRVSCICTLFAHLSTILSDWENSQQYAGQ